MADTVGAGSDDFNKLGRNVNGTWTEHAKSRRTRGQQSLAEAWAASTKASRNLPQGHRVDVTEMQPEQPLSNHEHIGEQGMSATSLHRHANQ